MRYILKNRKDSYNMNVSGKAVTGKFNYYIDLIIHLVKRDFTLRYKDSALGILWSVIPPVAHFIILTFVFGKVIPLRIEGYPAYVFTSILPWTWVSSSIGGAGYIFTGNPSLVRRPNFSPWVLVIVDTFLNLLTYFILVPVLMIILVIHHRDITWFLLLFPLLILIQVMLLSGLSLIIATLNVFYRDIQHMASLAVMLLFFVTPIFYRTQAIGDKYKILFKVNPFAALIQGYQAIFFHGTAPDWGALSLACLASVIVCIVGIFTYRRKLNNIFDTI